MIMRLMSRKRWLAALMVVTVAGGLMSCGVGAQVTGHVSGYAYMQASVVKPMPVEARVVATPVVGDTDRSYSTTSASDGSFSFDLPPGTYQVDGTMIKPNPGDLATPVEVTVEADGVASVKLGFLYPGPVSQLPTSSQP